MEKGDQLIFIVGLGNPGKQYQNTPHNVGFASVDEFVRRFEFPKFEMDINGILTSQKNFSAAKVIIAKPQMFMNNSGKALARFFEQKKIRRTKNYPNLWVINDDLDIPLGKIKISKNHGSAGHKGVQSIIDTLKTKNFVRFRVGIQTPEVLAKKIPPEKFVLKNISQKDRLTFLAAYQTAADALSYALTNGLEKAMTEFNK